MPKLNNPQKKILHGLMAELLDLRDSHKCLRCSKTERLQMSHVFPKGHYRRMEYDPSNLKWLCVGCHLFFWHKEPILAHRWLQSVFSKERMDYLHLRSQVTGGPLPTFNELKLDLENEIKKLKK